jgi:hypothetical protein
LLAQLKPKSLGSDPDAVEYERVSKIEEFQAVNVATFTAGLVRVSRQFEDTQPWWRGQRDATWSLVPSL